MSIHDYPYPLEICPHKPDGQGQCQACCKHRYIHGKAEMSGTVVSNARVECVACGTLMDPTKYKYHIEVQRG